MKFSLVLICFALLLVASACQPVAPICPPDSVTFVSDSSQFSLPSSPDLSPSPEQVEINDKTMSVDDVIHGPLCNSQWSGTIYVACDLQIIEWQEDPTFLKDCSLSIEPGTVVYVAAHNDAPYYKGCSCHTGEDPQ